MARVIVSVTNDLTTDNRVDKVCRTLSGLGWEVLLVGRQLPDSVPLARSYATHRLRLWFRKGFLFYAEYNLRLFCFLLFRKADVLHSNDLDTLPANCLALIFKRRCRVVYDSHEYFTEVPEIIHRPVVQFIWKMLERLFFQVPWRVFTVNESIAGLFRKKYHRDVEVIRNIPESAELPAATRADLALPGDRFILILQGAGINVHRGSEELLEAMTFLDDSYLLLVVGNGDVLPWLKEKTTEWNMQNRVRFLPRMPYREMMRYTRCADLGITLDKGENINYLYSLPNKIFDYIRAGIPVLASNLPEVAAIVRGYEVGYIADSHQPAEIARKIASVRADRIRYNVLRANTAVARQELTWENEVRPLVDCYRKAENHL